MAYSRVKYLDTIEKLAERDVEAVILGCTEISLLVEQQHTSTALYDTTKIHAAKAVDLAIMHIDRQQ